MTYILTEEDLQEIDKIINKHIENPATDWNYDSDLGYSIEDPSIQYTLKSAAIEIIAYIKTKQ